MRRATLAVVTAAMLVIPSVQAAAQDFTIRGVRLGMTAAEAWESLDSEVKARAQKEQVSIDPPPEDLFITRITTGGSSLDCGWIQSGEAAPCLRFHAIASDHSPSPKPRIFLIWVQERFALPISLSAFRDRISEIYGKPQAELLPTEKEWFKFGDVTHRFTKPNAVWLWSKDEIRRTKGLDEWLEKLPLTGNDELFEKPALRIDAYVVKDQVRGMHILAFDPIRFRAHNEPFAARRKAREAERQGRAIEQLKLR